LEKDKIGREGGERERQKERERLGGKDKDKEKHKEKEREKEKEKEKEREGGREKEKDKEKMEGIPLIKMEELSLIEAIGTGSFGQVYKAKYKDRLVAVKFGDGTRKRDFAHEISILSKVSHPNIVELYGASAGTRFFLVMELGVTSLANYYKTHEYSIHEVRSWALQIAEVPPLLFPSLPLPPNMSNHFLLSLFTCCAALSFASCSPPLSLPLPVPPPLFRQ